MFFVLLAVAMLQSLAEASTSTREAAVSSTQIADTNTSSVPSKTARTATWFAPNDLSAQTGRKYAIYGTRRDLFENVKPVFDAWGMTQTTVDRGDWHVLWAVMWDGKNSVEAALKPSKMVNAISYMARNTLGRKDLLLRSMQACFQRFGDVACDMIPVAFQLPHMYEEWRRYTAMHDLDAGKFWILKPSHGWSGKGVSVIRATDPVPREGSWVAQRYVSNLLLYHKRKFDFRVWALITSLNPLRVSFLNESLAKIAPHPYSQSPSTFKDLCVHNTAPPNHCNFSFHNSGLAQLHMNNRKFWSAISRGPDEPTIDAKEMWETYQNVIWPNVERSVMKSILMVYETHLKLEKKSGRESKHSFRRFQWLHIDVILDRDYHPWVEEVNCNGFMIGDRYGYKSTPLMVEGLDVAGIRGFDRTHRSAEELSLPADYCAARVAHKYSHPSQAGDYFQKTHHAHGQDQFPLCTEEDTDALTDMIDEEGVYSTTAPHWYRVFPRIQDVNPDSTADPSALARRERNTKELLIFFPIAEGADHSTEVTQHLPHESPTEFIGWGHWRKYVPDDLQTLKGDSKSLGVLDNCRNEVLWDFLLWRQWKQSQNSSSLFPSDTAASAPPPIADFVSPVLSSTNKANL